jgi:mannose/fructose/N-acetylgalactosamine-specific phosphotransferase system component IIC
VIETLVVLSVLGAFLSLDITMFGQFMVSRPIFAGPIVGYILGDINTGFWLGMIVEMMWINAIPLGTSIPVDLTMMPVLSVSWSWLHFKGSQDAAIFALAIAVPFAYLYREVDIAGRLFNTKIMHWIEKGIEQGKEYRISLGLYSGLILFILRAAIVYFVFMVLGGLIYINMAVYIPSGLEIGFKKACYYLPVFGFGLVLYNFKNIIGIPFLKKKDE